MKVLGISSGTSFDGIDAVVVEFESRNDELFAAVLARSETDYSAQLRSGLLELLPPQLVSAQQIVEVDTRVGQEFAEAAVMLAESVGGVDAICSHGQTIFHWVDDSGAARGTLQVGQPAWIAERADVPVIADVRARDIAAGGQGAPLVALLDQLLLADHSDTHAALNLGGIANVTVVAPGQPTIAYDVGPANALIDAVVTSLHLNDVGYDVDGALARQGTVDHDLLAAFLADPFYRQAPPKSTGKEYFNMEYIRKIVADCTVASVDLVRTLTELTARTVADAISAHEPQGVWLSGGGCHNPVLMARLRQLLPDVSLKLTSDLGASVDDKEAILFALIGWYHLAGIPAAVPSATGAATARILGSLTPGKSGSYPRLHVIPPRKLTIRQ